jgi:hypothetical protein
LPPDKEISTGEEIAIARLETSNTPSMYDLTILVDEIS